MNKFVLGIMYWIKYKLVITLRLLLMNRMTLLLLSCILSLIVSELSYRLVVDGSIDKNSLYSVSTTGNQYNFYQFDPLLGWSNKPDVWGIYKRDEFAYKVSINSYGMRQKSISKIKKKGIYRIAILGDSFVWGIGVDNDHRVTESLERILPRTEVLNFGVSGYSPIQYLLMIDSVIAFQPNLIIMIFCLGNDYEDNVYFERYGHYKPYAILENNELRIEGYPLPNVKKYVVGTRKSIYGSRFLADLQNAIVKLFIKQKGLIGFNNELIFKDSNHLTKTEIELKMKAISINEILISKIYKILKNNSIGFIVADAPTKREYYDPLNNENRVFRSIEIELEKTCNRIGVQFIPNISSLDGHDFWEKDQHWNYEGNRKIAFNIKSYLLNTEYYKMMINKKKK